MDQNTIYSLFEKQVQANPDALAIIEETRKVTRKELQQLVEKIESHFPEDSKKIGIVMNHGIEMIASILAVLKSGKTYIPVEPFFPINRINYMMNDSEVDLILTNQEYQDRVNSFPVLTIETISNSKENKNNTLVSANPNDLAYILYTSGSTGKPKGVAVTNQNVTHYIKAFQNEFKLTHSDIVLQYSVCSFDIFVEEVFSTLLNGAILAIPSEETRNNFKKLIKFINKNKVSVVSGFPYLFLEFNHLDQLPNSLRLFISGGDVLRESYISNLIDKIDIYNTYGPSETTVCATYFKVNDTKALPDGTYPIGKPVLGSIVEISDKNNILGEGEIGEICISGSGVSAGYIGQNQSENRNFVTKGDGSRWYRSGDLGYYLPDGNIAFVNRKDNQIMIQGKRVEPLEVESVLCNCKGIEKAVVLPYQDEQNLSYMTAYIVFNEDKELFSDLIVELENFLPDYMIPEFFVELKDIPLNENGKVDKNKLPIVLKKDFLF